MLVPPDPLRRFVDKRQIKQIYGANGQDNAHGYEFVDEDENINSAFGASLLRLGPARGARLALHLDRHALRGRHRRAVLQRQHRRPSVPVARARAASSRQRQRQADRGVRPPPDPLAELERPGRGGGAVHRRHRHRTATCPSTTTTRAATSTRAPPTPIHYGEPSQRPPGSTDETISELFTRFPHVIAYVAGHTHENRVQPFTARGRRRVVGHRDRGHRRLAGPAPARRADGQPRRHAVDLRHGARRRVRRRRRRRPAPRWRSTRRCWPRSAASSPTTIRRPGSGSGEGTATDQNVELLVKDPRTARTSSSSSPTRPTR